MPRMGPTVRDRSSYSWWFPSQVKTRAGGDPHKDASEKFRRCNSASAALARAPHGIVIRFRAGASSLHVVAAMPTARATSPESGADAGRWVDERPPPDG